MRADLMKASLPAPRRRLVEVMQRLHFGQILGLRVQGGQPVFEPPPRLVRDRKFPAEPAPRPVSDRDDFLVKQQVVELFEFLDQFGDGVIDTLEVKHGLPFRVQHTEAPDPDRVAL